MSGRRKKVSKSLAKAFNKPAPKKSDGNSVFDSLFGSRKKKLQAGGKPKKRK